MIESRLACFRQNLCALLKIIHEGLIVDYGPLGAVTPED